MRYLWTMAAGNLDSWLHQRLKSSEEQLVVHKPVDGEYDDSDEDDGEYDEYANQKAEVHGRGTNGQHEGHVTPVLYRGEFN